MVPRPVLSVDIWSLLYHGCWPPGGWGWGGAGVEGWGWGCGVGWGSVSVAGVGVLRLSINLSSDQCTDPRVKDKTVIYLIWKSPHMEIRYLY